MDNQFCLDRKLNQTMNDNFEKIKRSILKFRDERNWKQFHQIKDLLIGLNMEVAELQELFLWKNTKEIQQISKKNIEEEIADIYIFLIYLCDILEVNLETAVWDKLKANEQKYPVEKSKGSNKKYNEL